jgi:hypothetical protein
MRNLDIVSGERNVTIVFGLVGIAIGLLAAITVEQTMSGKTPWLALAPVMVPVLFFMVLRPVFGAAAVIGFGFVNPSLLPPLIEVGPLSLRYVDGVFCLFVGVVLARNIIGRRPPIFAEICELFTPMLIFLLYIGVSVVLVRISAPSFVGASMASYMRLLLTASFVPVLCLTLRDKWDIQFFDKALILFSIATVIVGAGLVWAGGGEALAARSGGVIGVGPLGLVSGLLILNAVVVRGGSRQSMGWVFLLVLGILGLYMAKTASAAFAVAVTATVYFASMRSRQFNPLRWVAIGTMVMTVTALAIFSLRQNDVSAFANLSGGSFAERMMIAYAGLWMFLDNPLIGVGWQASTSPAILTSPALVTAVTDRFSHLHSDAFFVTPVTSLHNMYIQFLAELGMIGFVLFVWSSFRTGKRVARIVKNTPAESPHRRRVQFYALGLIYLLIWWNNSTLFGGQIETMLAFTFLALMVNVAQLERERVQQLAVTNSRSRIPCAL